MNTEKRSFRFSCQDGSYYLLKALWTSDAAAARPLTLIELLERDGEVILTVSTEVEDRVRSAMRGLGISFEEIPVREITFDDLFG